MSEERVADLGGAAVLPCAAIAGLAAEDVPTRPAVLP